MHRLLPLLALLLPFTPAFAQNPALKTEVEKHFKDAKQAHAAGQFDAAKANYKAAARLAAEAYGQRSNLYISAINDAGLALRELGEYEAAEELFAKGLELLPDITLPANSNREAWLGALHNNRGLALYQLGRQGSAEIHLRRALALRVGVLAALPKPPRPEDRADLKQLDIAETRDNLGLVLGNLGLLAQAAEQQKEALRIRTASNPRSPVVARSLSNLAMVYLSLQEPAALVDKCFQDALDIYLKDPKIGPEHPFVAAIYNNIGYVQTERGQSAEALRSFSAAQAIREKKLGLDHAHTGLTYHGLGIAHLQLEHYAEAEAFLTKALVNREKSQGPHSPGLIMTLHGLIALHVKQQQWSQAAAAADRVRRLVRRHTSAVLPLLSEPEQFTFMYGWSDQSTYFEALTLGCMRCASGDAALLNQSAEWLLNGKAVANECLCDLNLRARDSADPEIIKAVADLRATRQALAKARNLTPQEKDNDKHLQLIQNLERQEDGLRKRVGTLLTKGQRTGAWVELAAIRRQLAPDGLLIELVRMPYYDFNSKPGQKGFLPAHYVAWVIPPEGQGQVAVVDLGDAAAIDKAIDAVRDQFTPLADGDEVRKLKASQKPRTEQMNRLLAAVAERVLHPLLPHLGDQERRLTISPDGKLWLLPWAALPLPDGTYVVEKHRLNFLVSGRELVHARPQAVCQAPTIIADPDFGDARLAVPGVAAFFNPPVQSLPGFKQEPEVVKKFVGKVAAAEPICVMRRQASEASFKSLRSPAVLVLCTHGFFFEQAVALQNAPGAGGAAPVKTGRSNPLTRCGLVLAGVNECGKHADDGILTGLEIIDTDLRGTKLVMLSACETGLGDVRSGEGVVGLRQAFHLAGAEKVVATLWTIPDKETVQISHEFFKNLSEGKEANEALREAQLGIIKLQRKSFGASHPFFWAAFMLSGK